MNRLLMNRQRAGLGAGYGLGDESVYQQTRPRTVGSSSDSTPGWLQELIKGSFTLANTYIATRGGQPVAITQQPNGQMIQQPLTAAQAQQLLLAQQQQQLANASADSGGINIGGTRISYPVLMIGVLAIILFQSGRG